MYSEKCLTHKNGGGVLHAKNDMKVVKINKINVDAYDTMLKLRKKIRNIYRPPKLSEENDRILYDEIRSVIKDKNAVICGDFNNPSVNWSTLTADRERTRLLELTEEAFLYQIVQTPTRGNNILDLIFTNDSDIIHTCEIGEPLGTAITTSLELN